MPRAESSLGGEDVVRSAQESNVRRMAVASKSAGMAVIELEMAPRRAALALGADIGALLFIARGHLPPRRPRDVSVFRLPGWPRTIRLAEAGSLERRDQDVERALAHLCEISGTVTTTEQACRPFELFFELATGRQLHLVARGR